MCPTILGRIETRTATLLGPALLGTLLALLTANEGWIVLIGIVLLQGVVLDALFYPYVIKWQPPWLTFVLAAGEFVIVYVLAQVASVGLGTIDAILFYWLSWMIAVSTKIVVLPNLELSWIESGGEFRAAGWSVTSEMEPVPALGVAALSPGAGQARLVREFSAVHEIPPELRELPPPSGVWRVPEGLRESP
jgi:hypothetical protein